MAINNPFTKKIFTQQPFTDQATNNNTPSMKTNSIVKLNVGGKKFTTTLATLTQHSTSTLAQMFSSKQHKTLLDNHRNAFIDRNPDLFSHVLEYLRVGPKWEVPSDQSLSKQLKNEFEYFGLKFPIGEDDSLVKPKLPVDVPIFYAVKTDHIMKLERPGTLWTKLTDLPIKYESSYSCAALSHEGCIYVIGTKRLQKYDVAANVWTSLAPVRLPHVSTAVVLDGFIYAMGGTKGAEVAAVEKYDLKADQWCEVAPLPLKAVNMSAVALDGFLYVVGGTTSEHLCYNTMLRYSPHDNKWCRMKQMHVYRGRPFTCVLNSCVYAFGAGSHENAYSVECYSPVTDTWTRKTATLLCQYPTCVVHNNRVFSFRNGSLEYYDPTEKDYFIAIPHILHKEDVYITRLLTL